MLRALCRLDLRAANCGAGFRSGPCWLTMMDGCATFARSWPEMAGPDTRCLFNHALSRARYHAAAFGDGGGGTNRNKRKGNAATKAHTVFIKKEGTSMWVKCSVSPESLLADLVEGGVMKLGMSEPLSTLTVHQVTMDNDGKDVMSDALDSTESVEKALDLKQAKMRLVIKVAATNTADQRAGTAEAELLRTAILAAVPEPIHGAKSGAQLLRLPHQARWPQLGAEPLFVRHFYQDCYEGPLQSLEPGGRFIIRGNAGIGKSAFGLYLLYQAIRAGRTAMYVSDKVEYGYVFHDDGRVEALHRDRFRELTAHLRCRAEAVAIFDGDGDGKGIPQIVEATTVLITSPKRERYKEFQKSKVRHLVFPVFSRAEIEDMLKSCFSHLDNEGGRAEVWERYAKWGGIPRYLLHLLDEADQSDLDDALTVIDLDRLADVLGNSNIEDDTVASHRLFHLKPRGETDEGFTDGEKASAYVLVRTELGSPYIARKVANAIHQSRSNRLLTLLAQPTKGTSLAKFYGDVFEQHALEKLRTGGDFTTYKLQEPSEGHDKAREGKLEQRRVFQQCSRT